MLVWKNFKKSYETNTDYWNNSISCLFKSKFDVMRDFSMTTFFKTDSEDMIHKNKNSLYKAYEEEEKSGKVYIAPDIDIKEDEKTGNKNECCMKMNSFVIHVESYFMPDGYSSNDRLIVGLSFDICSFASSFFDSCIFYNCIFDKCELSLARFSNCIFRNCSFSNTNIVSSKFMKCVFDSCYFIQNTDLEKCSFYETMISLCSYTSCAFDNCEFTGGGIYDSDFNLCKLDRIDFLSHIISYCTFTTSPMYKCVYTDTYLLGCVLKNSEVISPISAYSASDGTFSDDDSYLGINAFNQFVDYSEEDESSDEEDDDDDEDDDEEDEDDGEVI